MMNAAPSRFKDLLVVFARLKSRLFLNALRRSWRARMGLFLLALVLGAAMSTFVTVLVDAGLRTSGGPRMSVAFTTLWIAWVGLPFILGGIDDAVDPDRLAELPLSRVELAAGTAVAASIGVLPVATLAALFGAVAKLSMQTIRAFPVLVVAVVLHYVLCLVGSRLIATLLVRASRSRRGRDLGVLMAAGVTSGLWMATQALPIVSPGSRRWITTALAWTPPGSVGRAVFDAVRGDLVVGALRLVYVLAVVALMSWWWTVEVSKSMIGRRSGGLWLRPARPVRTYGPRSTERVVRRAARGPIKHPVFVVVRKELRYLLRSPYRRAALLVGCLFGAPFVALQSTRMNPEVIPRVAIAPITLLFGIAVSHNLLGLDASSLWIEFGTGIRLRYLLLGRALAAAPTLVVPVWVSALVIAGVHRDATALGTTLALSVAAAGVPLGVGALLSVLVPFPVADDSSPFGNQSAMTGRGCLIGIVHSGGLLVSLILLAPVLSFAVMRGSVDALTVGVATVWSCVVLGAGVWLGERFADRHPGALAETVIAGLR